MFRSQEEASLNRWVWSWDLKVVMKSDCLLCWGRGFQGLGAEQLKAWAPMVLRREVGMVRSDYLPHVFMGKVRGGWIVEKFVGEENVFQLDCTGSQWRRITTGEMRSVDLVQVMIRANEFWMICSLSISLVGSPVRRVLNVWCDKWVDQDFSAGLGQWWVESGVVMEVEECSSGDVLNDRVLSRLMPRLLTFKEKTKRILWFMVRQNILCAILIDY